MAIEVRGKLEREHSHVEDAAHKKRSREIHVPRPFGSVISLRRAISVETKSPDKKPTKKIAISRAGSRIIDEGENWPVEGRRTPDGRVKSTMRKGRAKKRRPKKKHGKRCQAKKPYDVQMIRDFLEHLRLEYEVKHLENTGAGGATNRELADRLKKYTRKYNTTGLMFTPALHTPEGTPQKDAEKARERLRALLAKCSQEVLEALDVLRPAFEMAFKAASRRCRDKRVIRSHAVASVLSWAESEYEDDEYYVGDDYDQTGAARIRQTATGGN